MIKNFLKIAFRNLVRNRVYTLINIIGLTIGITSFLLILMYVEDELSYDKFVDDSENIYRCVEIQNAEGVGEQHVAITMGPLAPAMISTFPEVTNAVRFMGDWGGVLKYGEDRFIEDNGAYADTTVFEMLSVDLFLGNQETALSEINTMVISEKLANKIFESPENAMGKMITYNEGTSFKVTGVFRDTPKNAHYKISYLMSFENALERRPYLRDNWGSNSLITYVKLREGTDLEALHEKFPGFMQTNMDREPEDCYQLYLQPFEDIHLKSGHIKFQYNRNPGDINTIYVMSGVSLLILVIACINFINITIARSMKRAREVGMRKVLGATRAKLVYQFLGESLLITLIAILLSLALVEILLPEFNTLLYKALNLNFDFLLIGRILLILGVVSTLSGSYPAFYLSRYNPAKVLKENLSSSGRSGWLSKGLVVFQFVVAIGLIISIIIMRQQINYIQNKDLGLNYNDVMGVNLLNNVDNPDRLRAFKAELMQDPLIKDACFASGYNGVSGNQSTLNVDDTTETAMMTRLGFVDENYFDMMEIPILHGRSFAENSGTDSTMALILNEAAVEYLGWENPIGKRFQGVGDNESLMVVGVISNYHYYSLFSKIEPAAYGIMPSRMRHLLVKLDPGDINGGKKFVEQKWNDFFPGQPFESYFANERVRANYAGTNNSAKVLTFFMIITIVISGMGLYGLTSMITERRTKEIGVRKVVGGSSGQIVMLLLKDFLILVGIAGIIATPIAYQLMDRWLQEFAYHIDLNWYQFVLSIIGAGLVASLTIFFKAFRAARQNPVVALRYE